MAHLTLHSAPTVRTRHLYCAKTQPLEPGLDWIGSRPTVSCYVNAVCWNRLAAGARSWFRPMIVEPSPEFLILATHSPRRSRQSRQPLACPKRGHSATHASPGLSPYRSSIRAPVWPVGAVKGLNHLTVAFRTSPRSYASSSSVWALSQSLAGESDRMEIQSVPGNNLSLSFLCGLLSSLGMFD